MAVSHVRKSRCVLVFLSLTWGICGYAASLGTGDLQSGLGEPPQAKHHHPAPKARPVLRLSATGTAAEALGGILRLRLADRLMPSATASDIPDMRAPQTAPDDEYGKMQALMKDLHAEALALRAEAARMQQQNLAYRNELDSTRNASLNWIKSLAGLLAVCFAAVGWLLWRVFTMKRAASQPWHDPFTELHTETPDSERVEDHAESVMPEPCADESGAAQPQPQQRIEVPAIDEFAALVPLATRPAARVPCKGARPASVEAGRLLKTEEISDVMELVDAWMTLNAPDKVLELLRPFNDVEQPESPLPWLCLLDVYRAIGDQKKYEAILRRIKTLFNVKLAPWNAQSGHEPARMLADFPHVIEEITDLWHTTAIVPYLESLLHDDRNGTRHGFDLPAYRDILQLTTLASKPGRLTRRDLVIPDQARAILFGRREQIETPPSAPAVSSTKPTSSGAAAAAEKPQIHERQKHFPTPYEHASTLRQNTTNHTVAAKTGNLTHDPAGIVPSRQATPAASEQPNTSINPDDLSPIAIKLHLAIAYQDIGDNEGACLLLDEVIHDGNEEQAQQAKRMLAKLA